jgi:hypothetical protein
MSEISKPCPVCKSMKLLVEVYTTTKSMYYRIVCPKSCRKGDWRKSIIQANKAWYRELYSNTDEPGIV